MTRAEAEAAVIKEVIENVAAMRAFWKAQQEVRVTMAITSRIDDVYVSQVTEGHALARNAQSNVRLIAAVDALTALDEGATP